MAGPRDHLVLYMDDANAVLRRRRAGADLRAIATELQVSEPLAENVGFTWPALL
jgi:hypothetical protein